jgi:EAL domain-containing protein (putative c-di-GMP-specific phosphodiesterase class I)/GGDEF domain-containing protein
MSDSLIQAVPDLVAFVRADGVITSHLGGRQLQGSPNPNIVAGRNLSEAWSESVGQLFRQMIRRALASRTNVEARYLDGARRYEARVSPQGRQRVLCVIRDITDSESAPSLRAAGGATPPRAAGTERRGFLQRMKHSIAEAALREQPLSLGVIHLGGLTDIGQLLDFTIAERVVTAAFQRLPVCPAETPATELNWYTGQIGDALLAVVIQGTAEREVIRSTVQSLCDSLVAPLTVGDANFQLSPCAGVAIMGEDAAQPQALLEHARAALAESRRAGPGSLHFYSDTLRLLPELRLDFVRELRNAIAADEIELRYAGRHDLATGRLDAVHAYMRWRHPLRGVVHPGEFLPIAISNGLGVALSRCALSRVQKDMPALRAACGATARISFGPLREHLVSGTLMEEIEELLKSTGLEPGMLEVRIAEKTLASLSRADRVVSQLAARGTNLVIDEFGRGYSALARIAQLPIQALQIDRRYVTAAPEKPAALRFCLGAIALAHAYDLTPIASGIDNESVRQQMLGLGCEQGLGDCFGSISLSLAPQAAAPQLRPQAQAVGQVNA